MTTLYPLGMEMMNSMPATVMTYYRVGPGADYFDCGGGFDIVIGFNPAEGDTNANNCEDVIQQL